MKKLSHLPVLLNEVVEYFEPVNNGIIVDCTFGGGGHFREIYEKYNPEKIIGMDRDIETIIKTSKTINWNSQKMVLINDNFKNIKKYIQKLGINSVHGVLADLGTSTIQLLDGKRGFSFQQSGNLDMRMDRTKGITAADIINKCSSDELKEIIKDYGEERHAGRIVNNIMEYRKNNIIKTTTDLVEIIHKTIGKRSGKIDSATRTFQALRIAVNSELEILEKFLEDVLEILKPGGICQIITFHSLEDRIVKKFIQKESKDCICYPVLPKCLCNHNKKLKKITKKPVIATTEELKINLRARSAKLRVFKKL